LLGKTSQQESDKRMAHLNISIIGLGQLGSSFALALNNLAKQGTKHTFSITGTDKQGAKVRAALKNGVIGQDGGSFSEAVAKADLVFVAVPYGDLRDLYEIIGKHLRAGAVVIDTSPLKQPSIRWADQFFIRGSDGQLDAYMVGVDFIRNPDHLGSIGDDPDQASADLFSNGLVAISPALNCPPEAVQLVSDLTELLGIKPHFVDPAEHDAMIAGMENLPALLQLALFQSLVRSAGWADMAWLSNPAFFMATYQLAQTDAESVAGPIYRNKAFVAQRLTDLIESLQGLRDVLQSSDDLALAENYHEAMRDYAAWQMARQRGKRDAEPSPLEVRSNFSLMGGLLPRFGGGQANEPRGKKR
jgi:prephenate dehydrogenase